MPIPSSLTDVANLALTYLGEAPINNIDDPTDPLAQQMRRWIDVCVKEAQTTILWDELYTYNKPDFVTDSYAGVDGQYQYILPADFLHVIEVNALGPNTLPTTQDTRFPIDFNWKLQDGYLIARVENFEMFYARYEPSPARWSSELLKFTYHYLASKIAYTITDNASMKTAADQEFTAIKMEVLTSKGNKARRFSYRPGILGIASRKSSRSPRRF
jgi:hypothetical protein